MRRRTLSIVSLVLSALAGRAEVYVSTDAGETWSARGPKGFEVTRLVPDPKSPEVAWAIAMPTVAKPGEDLRFASPVILRTGDAGKTWDPNSPYNGPDPICVAVDPLIEDVVYVGGTFGRIQKSVDGGKSWTLLSLRDSCKKLDGKPAEPQMNVHAVFARGDRLLAAGNVARHGGFVALSGDGGKTWTLIREDFQATCVFAGDRILAANDLGWAVSSDDDGKTWTQFRLGGG